MIHVHQPGVYTRDEIIWLAGLLEGEGYFGLSVGRPRIALNMIDQDVVERAHQILQANCRVAILAPRKSWHKRQFRTAVSGPQAIGWMMMLYPFLGERRQQRIRQALTEWRRLPVYKQYRQHCLRGGHLLRISGVQGKRDCPECRRQRQRRGSSFHISPNQMALVM
jgi:hypothetical protein